MQHHRKKQQQSQTFPFELRTPNSPSTREPNPKTSVVIIYSIFDLHRVSQCLSPAPRTWTPAASSQPPPAVPADSTGACARGPRWPRRWDRCSSGGWGRWPSPRRISGCGTGTPWRTPRSACRSDSGPRKSHCCCCPRGRRGFLPNHSPGSLRSSPAERFGWGSKASPGLLLLLSLRLRGPRWGPFHRGTASAVRPGSCSRATCRSGPRRTGASSGPRLVFASLSSFGENFFAEFVRAFGESRICRRGLLLMCNNVLIESSANRSITGVWIDKKNTTVVQLGGGFFYLRNL